MAGVAQPAGGRTIVGSRRPPAAGVMYVALSTAIAVVLAAVAVTAAQSPPPAIAELAPAAVQQIKEAPSEQSSQVGSADGGGGPGGELAGATTTTTTPADDEAATAERPRIERARVNRCVGNPPRQIEDPQSPPCVPFWEGDNGGATYMGVTRDEVRIAVSDYPGIRERLEAFFNSRFEFYGRRLKLVVLNTASDCQSVKAGAERVQNEIKAFGSVSMWKADSCYMADLARRKLVGVTSDVTYTDAELGGLSPYVWAYPTQLDSFLAANGQWYCTRFAGQAARAADGLDTTGSPMASKPRKLGIIVQTDAVGRKFDLGALDRELSRCGVTATERFIAPDALMDAQTSTNVVVRFASAGVTTILCLCGQFQNLFLPGAASAQRYFPEWLTGTYLHSDSNPYVKTFWPDNEQKSNVMGLTVQPRQWSYDDTPMVWAQKEADPTFDPNREAGGVNYSQWNRYYRQIFLFAAGIQMAGPKLTPETFARGLRAATFPNPETPLRAGKVGFPGSSQAMTRDYAEFWWSETAVSPYGDGTGTICWVDGGARRAPGQWPKGDQPFFEGPCDNGVQRAE